MKLSTAIEWMNGAPEAETVNDELAGFDFPTGGADPESRATDGGPWFMCSHCSARLQARGCRLSGASPIWDNQIHNKCGICTTALQEATQ